jgi:hypothetical protein
MKARLLFWLHQRALWLDHRIHGSLQAFRLWCVKKM